METTDYILLTPKAECFKLTEMDIFHICQAVEDKATSLHNRKVAEVYWKLLEKLRQ